MPGNILEVVPRKAAKTRAGRAAVEGLLKEVENHTVRMEGGEAHYVLTGRGGVPVKRQVELLVEAGYAGYYSFEWEKAWHPELEEPEVAIADFARVVKQYLQAATAKQKPSSVFRN